MMTKKNLTPKKISGWLTIIIIFLIIVILALVSNFLYVNFYQTITQTKKIAVLESDVPAYAIDMKKFDLIMDRLAKKTQPKDLGDITSPFR